MKSTRVNLAEKFLLLALDDEKGRVYATNSISVSYGMAAAILVVMALRRKIQTNQSGNLEVVESRSQEAVLQLTLKLIENSAIQYPMHYWVSRIARNHLKNQQLILDDLCEKKILFVEETQVDSQFNIKHYPTLNPEPKQTLRKQISAYIQGDEALQPSLFFLLLLIQACGIMDEVFPLEQRDIAKSKLEALERAEIPSSCLSPETAKTLESIHTALKRLFA